jgi:hypothetical protein
MTKPAAGLRDQELAELALRAYLEIEAEQEAKGAVPPRRENALTRFRGLFEVIGSIQLGLLVACFTILLNFVVVVMIFHFDVARYSSFLFPL